MRQPRRIIINDRCLRGPRTGVGHYVAELLARLPQEAQDLELFAFYSSCLARGKTGTAKPPAVGSSAPARSPARRPPWWLRRTALKLYNAAFRAASRLKGCTLYHEPNHIPAPWAGPIMTTIHDLSVLRYPEWHPADRVRWYDNDLQAGLARTTRFITVSEFTKREMVDLLNLPADRITVIPLGVREVFHPRPADQTRAWLGRNNLPADYLLYAGTIEPRKNVAGLLAAYASLPARTRENVPLVLAGVTGWGRQTVDEWISRHNLTTQVRVLGYVDDESLAYLYAGARALVWPTLYEGFGLPPLECMACNTPVITSNLASLPEVTADAALLVDPQNTNELSEAMTRILEDRPLAESLRTAGLQRASQLTWPRCAQQHADEYRRTLNA